MDFINMEQGCRCQVEKPSRSSRSDAYGLQTRSRTTGQISPRRTAMMNVLRILAACGAVASTIATAEAQGTDWTKVDGILGRTGAVGGQVHRYGFPYYPYVVAKDVDTFTNGEISVRFQGLSGRIDQGAGILFNLKPNADYLTIRTNCLE